MRQKLVWAVLMPAFVLNITLASLPAWGGGFKVNQLYRLTGAIDASDWFASHSGGGGNLQASNTAASWYDAPASSVPEPGSLILLGTGILAVARRLRREKSGEQAS